MIGLSRKVIRETTLHCVNEFEKKRYTVSLIEWAGDYQPFFNIETTYSSIDSPKGARAGVLKPCGTSFTEAVRRFDEVVQSKLKRHYMAQPGLSFDLGYGATRLAESRGESRNGSISLEAERQSNYDELFNDLGESW